MHKRFWYLILSVLVSASVSQRAMATIVQLDFSIGLTPAPPVYVELLDQDAPATVANFLNYVENSSGERRYDNTFVHRLSAGFVIQLGGYTFDPALGSFEGAGVSHILEDPPVVNEFSVDRSNVRGTLAMAKLGSDPNSARSEWFFNLADNSANLDAQNGGFTVFGRVLGTGMDTVDTIAGLDIQDASFPALPVVDLTPGDAITPANLVTLNRVLENPPAAISLEDASPAFGQVELNTGPRTHVMPIQNIGATDLLIGTVAGTDTLSAPFSIISDGCSNQTLASLQTCSLTIEFRPTVPGKAQDSFNIPSNASNLPDLIISVAGTGVSQDPVLNVTPSGPIEFPDVLTGETRSRDVTLENIGGGLLLPGIVTIAGADSDAFSIAENNCSGASLALGETCTLKIEVFGAGEGSKTATLQIEAEPGNQVYQADMAGSVTLAFPDIDVTSPIKIGNGVVGETLDWGFGVRNPGMAPLEITGIEVIGADAALFALGDICIREIKAGFGCSETLAFAPVLAVDSVDAIVRITSNDPDTPVLEVPIEANAGADRDGIPDAIENAAPNGGDGNFDGTADSVQSHVTSLPNLNGDYVTIETTAGQTLLDVTAIENPSPANSPATFGSASLDFNHGFFRFTILDVPVGGQATVTIRSPGIGVANSYFKYGVSSESRFLSRWYQFTYDGQTGAEFPGDRVVLHFVDGGRGDSDLLANGRISDPGGPATISLADSPSGGGGGCTLHTRGNRIGASMYAADIIALLAGLTLIRLLRHRDIN